MRRRLVAIALLLASCSSPPAIPHAISQTSDASCATCHLEGVDAAPITPHPQRLNCVGCHSATGTAEVGAQGAWPPIEIALTPNTGPGGVVP